MDRIMYEVRLGSYPQIAKVIVTRTTESSVWLKGRRGHSQKLSSYYNYMDTFEEAHTLMCNSAKEALHQMHIQAEALQRQTKSREKELQEAIEFTEENVIPLKEEYNE